jgi:hypothetical protein
MLCLYLLRSAFFFYDVLGRSVSCKQCYSVWTPFGPCFWLVISVLVFITLGRKTFAIFSARVFPIQEWYTRRRMDRRHLHSNQEPFFFSECSFWSSKICLKSVYWVKITIFWDVRPCIVIEIYSNKLPVASKRPESLPSRSFKISVALNVVTSTWWEGLVLPMIPRAMPAGA